MVAAPLLPIDGIDPLGTRMLQSIRQERLLTHVATAFGVLALLLAAIGLYGVMTYAVTRRTGEVGLRVALGAAQEDIVRLVLVDALRLMAAGLVVGLPLALVLTRLLQAQLHGVQPADPVSLVTALVMLAASGFIAVALPAYRAARVAPTLALRDS